ncbi:MAG TPA: imidazole glycerol phosphate synthase subunit HisH [Verrucomicrobiales bacterium]|nr:imidazole glycerol phosphate synthase subunit HisH [Verrucomicrobiales bacterium]
MGERNDSGGLLGVVDYGAGNLRSVENALADLGASCRLVRRPKDLEGLSALILPGVGAFRDCVMNLRRQDLWEPAGEWVRANRPYLGICLGYQILFEESEEHGGGRGLGVFAGRVVRFPRGDWKVPHMGWNRLELRDRDDPLWAGLPPDPYVYFVHSFFPRPEQEGLVAAWADYGLRFAAAMRWGNVAATQFHPEKSQAIGLRILRNFVAATGVDLGGSPDFSLRAEVGTGE